MFATEATKSFFKATEAAATKWWDAVLRAPATLESMGSSLNGLSGAKARWDRGVEQAWSLWRLPTALDVERLHERLGELEGQLADVSEQLEQARRQA